MQKKYVSALLAASMIFSTMPLSVSAVGLTGTGNGSSHVSQYGGYDVEASVSVQDGVITSLDVYGKNFTGDFVEENVSYLSIAVGGMKSSFIGKKADAASVDGVSGATYSSEAVNAAVSSAINSIPQATSQPDNDSTQNGGNSQNDNQQNTTTSGSVLENLQDGTYSVTGNMYKVDLVSSSMSDAAINHTVKLTVKDGKLRISLNFHGITITSIKGYLGSMKYYKTGYGKDSFSNPTGTLKDVTVESLQKYSDGTVISDSYGTDYPDIVSFDLISEALKDGIVPLQVTVPVMEAITTGAGTQNVYLKLDLNSLKNTTDDDKAFDETEELPENPNASAAPTEVPSSEPSAVPTETPSSEPSTVPTETPSSEPSIEPTESPSAVPSEMPAETKEPEQSTTNKDTLKTGALVKKNGNTYKVISEGKVSFKSAKKNVKNIVIPGTIKVNKKEFKVVSISQNAFKNNKKLTSIIIGKYVSKVGNNAFKGCKNLKTVKYAKGILAKTKKNLKKQIVKAGAKKAEFK